MHTEFKDIIWEFYKLHKRTFPWRETTNPYFIFLSEIMLQQTQTARVVEKYNEFISAFPSVHSLADASFSQVLGHWSGLGYNRRAKYLHESSKMIVTKHNGIFPSEVMHLDELPGVGTNTAAAIVVYAFNIPIPFIETNIRRIYIHHFFSDQDSVSDPSLLPLIEETMDRDNPREWFWALMDYGSYLSKVVENPNRKSKHYTKQSAFEGSIRQVRGSILKVLLLKQKLTKEELMMNVSGDKTLLDAALQGLIKEGLITQNDTFFSVTEGQ